MRSFVVVRRQPTTPNFWTVSEVAEATFLGDQEVNPATDYVWTFLRSLIDEVDDYFDTGGSWRELGQGVIAQKVEVARETRPPDVVLRSIRKEEHRLQALLSDADPAIVDKARKQFMDNGLDVPPELTSTRRDPARQAK